MFWKKKKLRDTASNQILGMIILRTEESFSIDTLREDLIKTTQYKIENIEGDNTSATISIDGEMVMIGHVPVPIPGQDIEQTSAYAYNWQTVLEDTRDHQSHLLVAILQVIKVR